MAEAPATIRRAPRRRRHGRGRIDTRADRVINRFVYRSDNRYAYTLASYRALLADGSFYGMAAVTAIFVAGSVILQLTIGFLLVWLIDAGGGRRARSSRGSRSSARG